MKHVCLPFAVLVVVLSCASHEDIGSQVAGITVHPNVQLAPFNGATSSASALCYGATTSGPTSLVHAFDTTQPPPGWGIFGWDVSTDVPYHTSWLSHYEYANANDTFFVGSPPTMSDGAPYGRSRSNPWLVATGWPNQIAMVTLANSATQAPGAQPVDVILTISNDGGNSFKNLFVVSLGATGVVDQPKITIEQHTHVGYVVWASRTGSDPWHPYTRRFHFKNGGTWDPPPPVTDMQLPTDARNAYNFMNVAAVCDAAHASNDNCALGTENLWV